MIPNKDTGTQPDSNRTLLGLSLVGALGVTFDAWLDIMDQWGQPSWCAIHKRTYGDHRVYLDGVRVGDDRTGQLTLTATQLGRLACALHVALQTSGHVAATLAITRLVGYRIPMPAVLAAAVLNGVTHFALDRGALLEALALLFDKDDYLHNCTVVRAEGKPPWLHGEGTAWNALDRSGHKAFGWLATTVTVALALRWGGQR